MSACLIGSDDSKWGETLARTRHDVYHLPSYCEFAAREQNGVAAALYASSDDAACLVPLVIRRIPRALDPGGLWRDASSPYGYPSPLLTPATEAGQARALLDACVNVAMGEGLVSLFVRLHPLLPLQEACLDALGTVVRQGETVYVDLAKSYGELEAAFSAGHRYEIRRLRRLGYRTTIDEWEKLPAFAALYRQTMVRVGARSFYLFGDEYFTGLQSALGDALHLCLAYSPDGILAAGALYTDCCGIMQYHLSGVASEFVRSSPTKLVLSEIVAWGACHQRQFLHLGGGVGANDDSLFRFKAGFSDRRADFYSCRIIALPERYGELSESGRVVVAEDSSQSSDYFPAYRDLGLD